MRLVTSLLKVVGLDFTSFCVCMAGFGAFLTYFFSLPQEVEKDEADFKYFN